MFVPSTKGYHVFRLPRPSPRLPSSAGTLVPGKLILVLLIRAVPLLDTVALLELGAVLGDRDLELAFSKVPAVADFAEVLGRLKVLEANGDDAVNLLVEENDLGDFAKLPGLITDLIFDVEDFALVLFEFVEREDILHNADLGPLVLLGSKSLLDLLLVIGPFGEFAV
jgi:hypothetical protein